MERDKTLDILKCLGILMIIFAHCLNKPTILDYARNFEVILLVVVSAILLYPKFTMCDDFKSMLKMVKTRIKRIVVPTWFFLVLLFVGVSTISLFRGRPFPYTARVVVDSFLLINGIGYVWIMLVYCWIAIGVPILLTFFKKHNINRKKQLINVLMMFLVYYALRMVILYMIPEGMIQYYLKNTILYFLAYVTISIVPYFLVKLPKINTFISGIILITVHFCLFGWNLLNGISPYYLMQETKYPPSLFYITYGLGMSLVLLYMIDKIQKRLKSKKIIFPGYGGVVFVSKNSQWVYFNHIIMIFAYNEIFGSGSNWIAMYVFILIGALFLTIVQQAFVLCVKKTCKVKLYNVIKVLLG